MNGQQRQKNAGLYRPSFEHDNCGIGAIVNIKGQKSHDTVANALKIVEQLEHRAGKDAEGKTGDGWCSLLLVFDAEGQEFGTEYRCSFLCTSGPFAL